MDMKHYSRKDKIRLDWMEENGAHIWCDWSGGRRWSVRSEKTGATWHDSLRDAIDAAMIQSGDGAKLDQLRSGRAYEAVLYD